MGLLLFPLPLPWWLLGAAGGTEMNFRRKLMVWVPLSWVRVGWSCFSFRCRSPGGCRGQQMEQGWFSAAS
jgi:hypothetical protein